MAGSRSNPGWPRSSVKYETCGAVPTCPDLFVIKSDVVMFCLRKARRRARSSCELCAESRPWGTTNHHNFRQSYAFSCACRLKIIANPLLAFEVDPRKFVGTRLCSFRVINMGYG